MLSKNSRASLEAMGKAVGLEGASINYRINKLIEKQVITSFRADIAYEKLGYKLHKVDLHLGSLKRKKEIEDYICTKPAVSHILRTIGWADIEMQIYAHSSKELGEILHEVQDKFPEDVQDYDFIEYSKMTKDNWIGILLGRQG